MRRPNKDEKIYCGKLGRVVGLRGEMKFHPASGEMSFSKGDDVFVGTENKNELHKVAALRKQGRFFILEISGVETRVAAQLYNGKHVFVLAADLPKLSKDEYYCYEIEGLEVVTVDGKKVGSVVGVISTGANDVYEVRSERYGEVLIPAIKDVIVKIDMKARVMTIDPLKGMLEENV